MPLSKHLGWALAPPLLAAACSLAIDTKRDFESNLNQEDSGPGAGGTDASNDGGAGCLPESRGCSGQRTFYCEHGQIHIDGLCSGDTPKCVKGECLTCIPESVQCKNDTLLQFCVDGQWQDRETCQIEKQCVVDGCVDNKAPVVDILEPQGDKEFRLEDFVTSASVRLEGRASDEDNRTGAIEDLSDAIIWSTTREDAPDIVLRYGPNSGMTVPLENVFGCKQGGTHYVVRATATDRAGAEGSRFIRVTVRNQKECPDG